MRACSAPTSKQLLRHVYLPSATSWVFSSLHTSVGLAFVGAVVGEYLGSARGVGYLILQAEGTFDVNTVFAGIVVLTAFALVLDGLVGRIEKRLMKWQPRAARPRSSDAATLGRSSRRARAARVRRQQHGRPARSTATPIQAALQPPSAWLYTYDRLDHSM